MLNSPPNDVIRACMDVSPKLPSDWARARSSSVLPTPLSVAAKLSRPSMSAGVMVTREAWA